jgi:uroporphyrinogen decarboxylase
MMISPDVYRRFLKPRMAKLIRQIKSANPRTLVFYHTDGVVDPVVDDFVEIGIDILNPVQRECMDIGTLKNTYGNRLSFWGGLSVQRTLPFGSPEQVRAETREIAAAAGSGGGLCIAPGHLVERDIPLENVYAFADAVREINEER